MGIVTSRLHSTSRTGSDSRFSSHVRLPDFGDRAADWDEPDALYKRIQAAQALAERFPAGRRAMSPLAIAGAALGASLDTETATALRRAESVRQGVALLLASPAFQWRA